MDKKKILKEWIIPIICVFVLFVLIRQFIFFTAVIPSESMVPTLQVKDRLITSRIFSEDNLEIGDVVVFNGGEHDHMHIKRIIGLPGDTIDLKENGEIYVNGELLDEPYINDEVSDHNHSDCGHHDHAEPNIGEFKIPEGKVFFLGDNRAASFDSRYWSDPYVNIDDIVGKPLFRMWPLSRFGGIE